MLGHFASDGDKARYQRKTVLLIDEIARQVQAKLSRASEPQRVIAVLDSDAFSSFFDELLERWDDIRSPKGYVRTALYNMGI